MKIEQIVRRSRALAKPFRITDGRQFRLDHIDPGETLAFGSEDKPRAREALATGIEALAELQDMLYAQDRWAVLLVFQVLLLQVDIAPLLLTMIPLEELLERLLKVVF
jgi:hypothetical protein